MLSSPILTHKPAPIVQEVSDDWNFQAHQEAFEKNCQDMEILLYTMEERNKNLSKKIDSMFIMVIHRNLVFIFQKINEKTKLIHTNAVALKFLLHEKLSDGYALKRHAFKIIACSMVAVSVMGFGFAIARRNHLCF